MGANALEDNEGKLQSEIDDWASLEDFFFFVNSVFLFLFYAKLTDKSKCFF